MNTYDKSIMNDLKYVLRYIQVPFYTQYTKTAIRVIVGPEDWVYSTMWHNRLNKGLLSILEESIEYISRERH